jgi:exodeoxyribonuclease VII small subunit
MTKKLKLPDLEKSLSEINVLVGQMEGSELTLEQSLTHFERGIILIKHAHTILSEAEQKVQLLINNRGEEKLTPYENNDE